MMEVNGKHLILGTPSPQAIDMKFDTNDYVGGATHTPNILKIGPTEPPRQRGEIWC